jgi:outer membrane receptor protein involved in Fe transport
MALAMAPRSHRAFACLLALTALSAGSLWAQAVTGTLKGRVLAGGKTGLPGAVVTLRSREQPTGNKQTITDVEGNYRIPLLPVANDYVLRVAYPGFAPVEVGPIDLDAGKTVVQDVGLSSDAETTETVVVEAQGSIVDTESTKSSSSYNAEFIEGLPLIGRNYLDILTLSPGVTDTDGDGNPNVHGARETGMQYRLDGINITDPVSGAFGQNLNIEMVEEVEVITSGASAEYGRADGGFANIITKSGGNDFQGSFKAFWRGKFLDGNGAGNNDIAGRTSGDVWRPDPADFHDLRASLTLGGAIVRDHLWYFGSVENLNTETPRNLVGTGTLVTTRGNYGFAKLTWQADLSHKLTLQATADPRTYRGLALSAGVAPESDYTLQEGRIVPQLKWTATISPRLLLESSISAYHGRTRVRPVSPLFRPTTVALQVTDDTVQAVYPCDVINCSPEGGEHDIYQINQLTRQVTGPYHLNFDQKSIRNAIKTDLSLTIEDFLGQHSIKTGIEFQDEKYRDAPLSNPILFDATYRYTPRFGEPVSSPLERVSGHQVLLVYEPLVTPQAVAGFNSGAYVVDSWKPRSNVTLNLGLRLDREDIDSSGYTFFDPVRERRDAVRLWRSVCREADLLDRATADFGLVTSQNCYQYEVNHASFDGKPSEFGEVLPLDHPARPITDPAIRRLDKNQDGRLTAAEGDALMEGFTAYAERETTNFKIVNSNLAPRVSVSWDPWADGRMKTFATWGRYYDRLFLGAVAQEIGPDSFSYVFLPDLATHVIDVGSLSKVASRISITQTDRSLRTPRTDEFTVGFERELAPEWSAGVTYIRRQGRDLLQDTDVNHITCPEHGWIEVEPRAICWNGQILDTDHFGDVGGRIGHYSTGMVGGLPGFNAASEGGRPLPNGAPDLYTVNFNFNRVLRIGNVNSYDYESWEVKLVKRLHRNWQMQASYAWSEAFGEAESFLSSTGNDPETKDDEEGYLSYDQRHLLKLQTVTRLPHGLSLGATVQWASGTPWSVVRRISELDSSGNIMLRTFYPSSQRNDQRNVGVWELDGRLEKSFEIGRLRASAFLNVDNLLNSDDLTILQVNQQSVGAGGMSSYREFGRRFELGASFQF